MSVGSRHELLAKLFRDHPELALTLARRAGVEVPLDTSMSIASPDMSQLAPIEFRADAVLRYSRDGGVLASFVIEVQQGIDPTKDLTWPVYWSVERAEHGADTWLLVATFDKSVAAWASKIIKGGSGLVAPLVIGPGEIPRVESPEEACGSLGLAVLSLLAHCEEEGAAKIAQATNYALRRLALADEDRAAQYFVSIRKAVGDLLLDQLLENDMREEFDIETSAWAERWIKKGEVRGEARGEARGVALGEARGVARGVVLGEAQLLLRQLAKRFGTLAEETTSRIKAATVEQIERGADAFADARSLSEVLDAIGVR